MSANLRLPPCSTETASPEEEELRRKQAELEDLRSELAESELELATLRSELIAFERRYLEVVGCRYAELDTLEAQIAEAVARSRPADPSARQQAESARAAPRNRQRRWATPAANLPRRASRPARNSRHCIARRPRSCTPI